MAGTQKVNIGQAKDIVRNVIQFIKIDDIDTQNLQDSVEADILKEYIKNPDFSLALRCVCIDNDISELLRTTIDRTYNVNKIECVLETDDEIRIFWSALSPDELLKQSIIHFQENS